MITIPVSYLPFPPYSILSHIIFFMRTNKFSLRLYVLKIYFNLKLAYGAAILNLISNRLVVGVCRNTKYQIIKQTQFVKNGSSPNYPTALLVILNVTEYFVTFYIESCISFFPPINFLVNIRNQIHAFTPVTVML